jgi:hypothetical protein
LARPNVLVLAADADLLVFLVEGRAQASAAVALRLGGTESVLLALLQAVILRVVQERANFHWHSAGLETWEGSGTKGAGEDEGDFHGNVERFVDGGWW